jgi:N-acetyl sugar amidotransferase
MQNKMQQCSRCLYTSLHPLGITFNDEGVCSGCQIHEEKDSLDWDGRLQALKKIIKPYQRGKKQYDCIIPVTGGNDSHFIVHVVKNILKLEPLLVTYNKYFNTPLGIRNLANLRIKFDCDLLTQNINPQIVKKITKHTLRKYGSLYWPCLAGQTVFPVQTAIRYKIPLIIWGAHQGLEQVGMFSHLHEAEMTRRYRKDHDLFGVEAEDLITDFSTLTEGDIWQYRYPDDADLHLEGVRGIYLGNYIRWDPKAQHESMIKQFDYKSSKFHRTFDAYDHVDCYNFMDLHDHIKFLKNGYSKVTDHACREIRHKRLSRQHALKLVKKFENKKLKFVKQFCEWLHIDQVGLNFILNQHRNRLIWDEVEPNIYKKKKLNFSNQGKVNLVEKEHSLKFLQNSSIDMSSDTKYITIGKGYPL